MRYKKIFKERTDEQIWFEKFEDFIYYTMSMLQLNDDTEAIVEIVAECVREYGGLSHSKYLFENAIEVFKSNVGK